MGTVTLLLGIHNHQPQGNFDHVFAQGYDDCYRRLLDAVARHPLVRWNLHYSGPLIEWIEEHHPDYFDQLAELCGDGQVEMMGGGFYEPMLSVLPERDALGQLRMMAEFLEGRVGQRPRGMWLAERVWEPELARIIAQGGHRYTIVDDGHFLAAGMRRPLHGYYVTDKGGLPLCLFPISIELRYAIPFKQPQEIIDLVHRIADDAGDREIVLTYGDDGEKFGMWPGTGQWVWNEGWLDRFLELLEKDAERIRTATFSEVLQRFPPSGRVYLPTASYDEMGEWALPAEAQRRLHALSRAVSELGHKEDWGPFIRGGIWQGFLAKYEEANFMHKRMCFVSERVARAAAQLGDGDSAEAYRAHETAVRELYRGQCNCAYWHGLFGGLYLAKLRSAVHGHLIRADVEASKLLGESQPISLTRADLDADLSDEVILTGRRLGLVVSPARGGTMLAIDDRSRAFCITDVLTRRVEAYHEKVVERSGAAEPDAGGAPKSIHEITHLKEEGLADLLIYDPHQRLAFVDQFFAADLAIEDIWRCRAVELGDFKEAAYDLPVSSGGAGRLTLRRTGRVKASNGETPVTLTKVIQLEEELLRVEYDLSPPPEGVLFATELSLVLPSGPHPAGRLRIATARETLEEAVTATAATTEVFRLELHDPTTGMLIRLLPSPAATLVRFPLQTASQSESGIERTYQGSVLVLLWPSTGAARFRPTVQLEVR